MSRLLRAEQPDLLIVILTARSDEIDVVVDLDAGADDYLVKPFNLTVLPARLRAQLRRRPDVATRTLAAPGTTSPSRWGRAKESHAQPPHHKVSTLMTAKPSGTAENGCAITMAPAASSTMCRFRASCCRPSWNSAREPCTDSARSVQQRSQVRQIRSHLVDRPPSAVRRPPSRERIDDRTPRNDRVGRHRRRPRDPVRGSRCGTRSTVAGRFVWHTAGGR
jgi:CheY-like chemotaxis protein